MTLPPMTLNFIPNEVSPYISRPWSSNNWFSSLVVVVDVLLLLLLLLSFIVVVLLLVALVGFRIARRYSTVSYCPSGSSSPKREVGGLGTVVDVAAASIVACRIVNRP